METLREVAKYPEAPVAPYFKPWINLAATTVEELCDIRCMVSLAKSSLTQTTHITIH